MKVTLLPAGRRDRTTAPPQVSMRHIPESHDGETDFTFHLSFSEDMAIDPEEMKEHSFTVTNGSVTSVTTTAEGNRNHEVTISPASAADITITVPTPQDCDAPGALCTSDNRKLYNGIQLTVSHQ